MLLSLDDVLYDFGTNVMVTTNPAIFRILALISCMSSDGGRHLPEDELAYESAEYVEDMLGGEYIV